ncbi:MULTISPECIES: flavodoxin domain-containing protein [unclassified Colwellia]|uniref:flavodoxin domain-containing protein n=1 Tax=unclassified Colwellia TaxID=196834 RepID=UPI0015F3BA97|nr:MULTISPECIES: flavodoxin domain-containing protein [unclassified Colwellia]MBA6347771.1 flavodoxin domain-containing protein [Colwellia sp. BRX8-9]MBA6351764.1 flavodoxin domain-containing protein [Colwellia sp. BRX9-1]MBA6364899.1 flavodoxin domain-containing protein [Colwellia sp. BRX8-8]MBA6370120.1 flavodoxin domain-containing protein [Colwellia sp. BRX8-4]
MSSFQIIVGSMLGGSEYVAEACEETLLALNHQTTLHLQPEFEQIIADNQTWLICTSTHGAGDFPDNIQKFVEDLKNSTIDLSPVKFMIIGLGDSNYDTFCKAAKDFQKLLLSRGCNEIVVIKTLDMSDEIDPEDLAQRWLETNKDLL